MQQHDDIHQREHYSQDHFLKKPEATFPYERFSPKEFLLKELMERKRKAAFCGRYLSNNLFRILRNPYFALPYRKNRFFCPDVGIGRQYV